MATEIEKKEKAIVKAVVKRIAQSGGSRNDVLRKSSILLNESYGINVAESNKYHGYLIEALSENCDYDSLYDK